MPKYISFPAYYDCAPLDISYVFAEEKPAGKHGFLQAKGDNFYFEDGTLVRFWGTNLNAGACFPEHDYAEKLAKRIAAYGCNMVRLHQVDSEFTTPNIYQMTKGQRLATTRKLCEESMERMDYLIYCLQQQGIYVYMDNLTFRKFKQADGVENSLSLTDRAAPYCLFNRKLIELQKEYMEQIWNHENPYLGGQKYKDNPQIVLTDVCNEVDLFGCFNQRIAVEPYVTEFREMYRAWCKENAPHEDVDGAQAPELTISGNAKLSGEGTSLYVNNASDVKVQFAGLTGADTLILVDAADKTTAFATADADYANYVFCADDTYLVNYTDGKLAFALDSNPKVAAVYQGDKLLARFSSLEAALEACDNGYIQLLADVQTDCVLTGMAWIDLNGFDLTGITVSGTLYGMDSATAEYDDTNAGVLTATVTESGQIVSSCKTTTEQFGAIQRYLTVAGDNNTYTFHRFYVGITRMSIAPVQYGIGYKAEFYGDDTVKAALQATDTFGYRLWIDGGQAIVRSYDADQFGVKTTVTLRVKNFLDPAKDEAFNRERANIPVNATVFITLASGEVIETDAASYSFKDMTQLAANSYDSYSADQQAALEALAQQFNGLMFTWTVPHIHHLDGSWTAWTKTDTLPTTTGKYYLTADVTLKSAATIAVGENVQLCLNGHNITTTATGARLINQKGTLSLTDCCKLSGGGTLSSAITTKYAAILYTYADSVTNIYGGNFDASQANITLGGAIQVQGGTLNIYGGNFVGANMVANADVTGVRGGVIHLLKSSTLNLYGGTIQGGTGAAEGGGISINGGAVVNMYGGTITGCTAVNGGGVYSAGTFNMYGGTIENCTATESGGNIFNDAYTNIYDGTIQDGIAVNGGNIYNDAVFTMTGGTVSGGRAEDKGDSVYVMGTEQTISGSAVIHNADGESLYLGAGKTVKLKDLTADAKIYVSMETPGTISEDIRYISNIYADDPTMDVQEVDGGIKLVDPAASAID